MKYPQNCLYFVALVAAFAHLPADTSAGLASDCYSSASVEMMVVVVVEAADMFLLDDGWIWEAAASPLNHAHAPP